MDHTLIAIFDNEAHAQNALNDLMAAGFPRADVHIRQSNPSGMPQSPLSSADDAAGHQSLGAKIESFFQNLFGGDNSDLYNEANKRGNPFLLMLARDDDGLMRATDLLNRHNAIDIRECSSQWEGPEQSTDVSAASNASRSDAAVTPAATESAAPAGMTAQRQTAQAGHHPGGQEMAALTGLAEPGMVPGDMEFRSHWQTSYSHQGGRYEDYAPAYQYGSTLQTDERYKGRGWDEIEPQLRADWEARHADSPWENAKEAVRAAWEKGMV
jgi:hypothetical protein